MNSTNRAEHMPSAAAAHHHYHMENVFERVLVPASLKHIFNAQIKFRFVKPPVFFSSHLDSDVSHQFENSKKSCRCFICRAYGEMYFKHCE